MRNGTRAVSRTQREVVHAHVSQRGHLEPLQARLDPAPDGVGQHGRQARVEIRQQVLQHAHAHPCEHPVGRLGGAGGGGARRAPLPSLPKPHGGGERQSGRSGRLHREVGERRERQEGVSSEEQRCDRASYAAGDKGGRRHLPEAHAVEHEQRGVNGVCDAGSAARRGGEGKRGGGEPSLLSTRQGAAGAAGRRVVGLLQRLLRQPHGGHVEANGGRASEQAEGDLTWQHSKPAVCEFCGRAWPRGTEGAAWPNRTREIEGVLSPPPAGRRELAARQPHASAA